MPEKADIGIALLGITGAFGVWSAMNTSPVGTVQFGKDNPKVAYQGMNLGLAVIGAMAGGIALHYGKSGIPAALATGLTGAGLWVWYHHMLRKGTAQGDAW